MTISLLLRIFFTDLVEQSNWSELGKPLMRRRDSCHPSQEVSTLRLRLKKPASDKKVQWSNETVDNEDMNKKKSNCCCIYTKPRSIEEESSSSSSSDSEDEECEHCKGHIKKKKKKHSHNSDHDHKEHTNERMLAVDGTSSTSKPGNKEKIPEHKEENGRTN